jgi:hypothetical protein
MAGIQSIALGSGGEKVWMVDDEEVCGGLRSAGVNCTNRGCDLIMWQKDGGRWREVFNEHLYRKFISVTETNRLAAIVASIYAGSRQCHPPRGVEYGSGQSCDVTIRFVRGQWKWERLN